MDAIIFFYYFFSNQTILIFIITFNAERNTKPYFVLPHFLRGSLNFSFFYSTFCEKVKK